MSAARFKGLVFLLSAAQVVACADREPLGSASATASDEPSGTSGPESGTTTSGGTSEPGTSETGTSEPGTTTTGLDTGGPTTGAPTTGEPLSDGQFLFALSTTISPDLPLQFIATNTWSGDESEALLRSEMQPLQLDLTAVTTPRTPVGAPLVLEMIAVSEGVFQLDLGAVELPGAANPITGGDLSVTLTLRGEFVSDDFYCGQVEGELTAPLKTSLTGSTFAAVRVAAGAELPLAVAIDCSGATVSDP